MFRIDRYFSILFSLVFLSCANHKQKNITLNQYNSDSILIKVINANGMPMLSGIIGIHFNDFEENSMDIVERKDRVKMLNNKYGIIKLCKKEIANYYRVNLNDSLPAFYYLHPNIYCPFVLDLNKDSITLQVQ